MTARDGIQISANDSTGNVPFGGYYQQQPPEDDPELTRTGPGTSCGEYFRKFWHPICLSEELTDLPLVVRILGEDLVVFRDKSGRIGVLHRHCSHRGTSLEYGIVSEHGIRCCYHGWLFDVEGTILETPGEPPDSRLRESIRHGAYPAKERYGLVFAYLGQPECVPDFPLFDVDEVAGDRVKPFSTFVPCNWLQQHENNVDPWHVVFLHSVLQAELGASAQMTEEHGAFPVMNWRETHGNNGMLWSAARRVDDFIWVRIFQTLLPNHGWTPSIWIEGDESVYFHRVSMDRWSVPHDDTSHTVFGLRHFNDLVDPEARGDWDAIGKEQVDFLDGQTGNRTYEEQQRDPGDWEVWVSQRTISARNLEHLGSTDLGVAMMRRTLRQAVRNEAGPSPLIATGSGSIPTCSSDCVLPIPARADEDDRTLLADIGAQVTDIVLDSLDIADRDKRRDHIVARVQALETSSPAN